MSVTMGTERRAGAAVGRRLGYIIAIVINAAILYAANRSPGWDVVPFLTDRTPEVLGLVNASLIAGIVANFVYVVWDPPRLHALGDLGTLSIGITAMTRIWQVFPFDFSAYSFNWEVVARILLGLGIAGSAIGIIVALVTLVRGGRRDAVDQSL
jgi:hypothetical protein